MDHTKFHTCSGSSCPEEVFWDPQGIFVLNTMGFSPALPESSKLLIGSFDIELARGDTLLREFDLLLSTLEGCSPREGACKLKMVLTWFLNYKKIAKHFNFVIAWIAKKIRKCEVLKVLIALKLRDE